MPTLFQDYFKEKAILAEGFYDALCVPRSWNSNIGGMGGRYVVDLVHMLSMDRLLRRQAYDESCFLRSPGHKSCSSLASSVLGKGSGIASGTLFSLELGPCALAIKSTMYSYFFRISELDNNWESKQLVAITVSILSLVEYIIS